MYKFEITIFLFFYKNFFLNIFHVNFWEAIYKLIFFFYFWLFSRHLIERAALRVLYKRERDERHKKKHRQQRHNNRTSIFDNERLTTGNPP